jgi:hypothetical protein
VDRETVIGGSLNFEAINSDEEELLENANFKFATFILFNYKMAQILFLHMALFRNWFNKILI